MAVLRCYQQKLSDEMVEALDAGEQPIAASPTGSGKSLVLADLALRFLVRGQRVVVLCHRLEILRQLQRTLTAHTDISPSICVRDQEPDWDHPLILGMVPSLVRRLGSTPTDRGGLLLLDEAHHSTAPSWVKTIEHLAPDYLAGCTATPVSASKPPLSSVFTKLIEGPSPSWLTERDHLAPARVLVADRTLDTKGVRIRHGDFQLGDLEAPALELAGFVVPTWRKHNSQGLSTIVPCVTINHSMLIASLYQEAAIPAAHVDGKMTMRERDQILTDFSAGRIKVLTFVGIVEEGIDIPEASVVQFLRPTKSVRLRRQIEGRVRRPHPGKEGCLIIDHTNSWETLPLPDEDVEWDLKKPGESGVSRKGKGKPEKQPDGEVVMVEATFREITAATKEAHQRWVKPSWLRGALDGSIDYRDETLRRISRGDDPKGMVMKDLETDAGCTFEHFQLVGMALSYAPAWAHHAYRRALSVRSTHLQKQEIQARVGSTMDAAWEAKLAAMPDMFRSMHEKPPHHLQAIGFDAEGKAVIAFGKKEQRSPIYLSQHADTRASLLKELQPAFPEWLVLLGLWQDLPLPEWDVAPSFEALV